MVGFIFKCLGEENEFALKRSEEMGWSKAEEIEVQMLLRTKESTILLPEGVLLALIKQHTKL